MVGQTQVANTVTAGAGPICQMDQMTPGFSLPSRTGTLRLSGNSQETGEGVGGASETAGLPRTSCRDFPSAERYFRQSAGATVSVASPSTA